MDEIENALERRAGLDQSFLNEQFLGDLLCVVYRRHDQRSSSLSRCPRNSPPKPKFLLNQLKIDRTRDSQTFRSCEFWTGFA